MPGYIVRVSGMASVQGRAYVEADTPEAAKEEALNLARGGNILWEYTGCEDDIRADEPEANADSPNDEIMELVRSGWLRSGPLSLDGPTLLKAEGKP